MTEDELIKLAHQAKLPFWSNTGIPIHLNELKRFVDLVREHFEKKEKKHD